MNIWEQFGEKPSIYAPEKGAEIVRPMTRLFERCGWLPLNSCFLNRERSFVASDEKLNKFPWAKSLAHIFERQANGDAVHVNVLADWSECYDKFYVGKNPGYDVDAAEEFNEEIEWRKKNRRYGERWRRVPNPNQSYFDWKNRRDSAARNTEEKIKDIQEYVLRNIVRSEDLNIEQKHFLLEYFARELYKDFWEKVSTGPDGLRPEKTIWCSRKEWCDEVYQKMPAYFREGAEIQKKVCAFTTYDFSAIASAIGPALPQMTTILQATAYQKIDRQLNTAIGYLDTFNESVEHSSRTGAFRENKLEQECNILKYRITIKVNDTGGGVVAREKVSRVVEDATTVGITAAVIGAGVAFPPLIGLAAIGMMIFGCATDGKRRRR